jgi:hypothetical protein
MMSINEHFFSFHKAVSVKFAIGVPIALRNNVRTAGKPAVCCNRAGG